MPHNNEKGAPCYETAPTTTAFNFNLNPVIRDFPSYFLLLTSYFNNVILCRTPGATNCLPSRNTHNAILTSLIFL